ncbi:hypothetical protein EAG_05153 [Camponotus floridanus]|uniref:Uncharacterized protein n=1 Tax=Camponotus floridanus TaxID=104421 RepID=E2A2M6_CAMFO|nr:hypothetical protein EAG_05153 [Camponotus floridanus]
MLGRIVIDFAFSKAILEKGGRTALLPHILSSNYIFLVRSKQYASAAIPKILSKAQVAEDKRWNELRLRQVISVLTHKCNPPDPQLNSHGRWSS